MEFLNSLYVIVVKLLTLFVKDWLDYVHSNTPEISKMTIDYFKKKGGDLMMWVYKMSRPSTAGDELALFLLCKIFNRHAVIHTIGGPWCTLNGTKNGTSSSTSLEDRCYIVLVHIVYGFCEASKIDTPKNLNDVITNSCNYQYPEKANESTINNKKGTEYYEHF